MYTHLANSSGIRGETSEPHMMGDIKVLSRVSNSATDGTSSVNEWIIPPYAGGVQSHWHHRTREVCYVLSGIVAFTLDEHTFTAGENDCVVIQPGVQHCIFNPTATPARILVCSTPGMEPEHVMSALQVGGLSQAVMEQYDYFCAPAQ